MPKRYFESLEEFEEYFRDVNEIIIDGTEMATERPKDPDNQRGKYSGKKSTHTDLALVISDRGLWIYYVSMLYFGKNVDFGVLKKEFPPGEGWFRKKRVLVDLGFIGIAKLYDILELVIGVKRKKKSKSNPKPKLTEEQKEHNRTVSRERIYVEHAIGRIKIFRILKNRCRLKSEMWKNRILGICAGLWNYKLLLKCC